MKRYVLVILFCILGITLSISTQAYAIIYPRSITSSMKDWKNLKISKFIMLSPKDYNKLTGIQMNLKERISFSIMKLNMKHLLKNNPNMTVSEYLAAHKKIGTIWWILIGLAAALLLLFIIALIFIGNLRRFGIVGG